ncbi:conserved exported hypothetical protein [Vibrio chagasii]|uniref:DUF5666 domain-containing protein n=1 Tax=Vibrio chagasii TaxID=170679 RepID=UPI001EFD0D28|nr:DUF5666 domain-containing protein [Vibrio chagasii]MCG9566054.1 DUF5666 domain-containing protein [Vibrio chagasii]CAH6782145.1 conserved exported hypothetical protein [Vibrio chagasii]CAH6835991.1 conserved exported hypothetical protein [Vibrio chagasii]CAH6836609.1 conserved exported hypothetical protein [Vibrio chagasii]CAH6840668.1 conserved exported hypothetical protein [Vibrio chagasii]
MRKLALITAISLVLAGCGGGSSDSSNTNEAHTPSSIQGTIDSVSGDTIVVNGYSYQVGSANYAGEEVAIADLEKNMMVSISSNARSASTHASGTQVGLEPTIVGLIANTNHVNGTFEVNGIPLTFSALSIEIEDGDWVMVSSLPTANAGYKVLSVVKFEHSNLTESVEVEGLISELDSNAKTFKLGANLSVDYSNAHIDNDDYSSELSNGLWVEVTGSMTGSILKADEVEVEDFDDVSSDTEIEGIITWVANDQSSFDLSYKGRFIVNNSTRYEDGNKSNLTVGAEVDVTTKKANGDNVATEIEFEHDDDAQDWNDNDIDLEGIVQSIDESALSFVIQTTSGNKTVYVNHNTRYEDGLTFNTLTNQRVEAETYKVNNQYIASEIEAEDNN